MSLLENQYFSCFFVLETDSLTVSQPFKSFDNVPGIVKRLTLEYNSGDIVLSAPGPIWVIFDLHDSVFTFRLIPKSKFCSYERTLRRIEYLVSEIRRALS